MAPKWKNRPEGSNWGEFGDDDQLGRINMLTPEKVKQGAAEIREGLSFCLSLPLDLPGGNILNPRRHPPVFQPIMREGQVAFNMPMSAVNPLLTTVTCDDAVLLHMQYSTQWDSLAHVGSLFDADGDGIDESVYYNGHSVLCEDTGAPTQGEVGACSLGIQGMAESGVQGRGVLIDLHARFGAERKLVNYDDLMGIMAADNVTVESGDMVLFHTGLGQYIMDCAGKPDAVTLQTGYSVLDGHDPRLLQWITDSGAVAIITDNYAVEDNRIQPTEATEHGPLLPLHEHCLFKLGVHLGEIWYLSELAAWLKENNRSRFMLTAPPLRLPGAVGSPATPVATV